MFYVVLSFIWWNKLVLKRRYPNTKAHCVTFQRTTIPNRHDKMTITIIKSMLDFK
jgi:hypothetical protein